MNRIPNWMYQQMIAHRGYFNTEFPENSLGAFQKAMESNYAIELDVQLLKDGTLVVFHDGNLKRMTGVDLNVLSCTYEDIKDLRLLDSEERIPTFDEVLKLVAGQVPLMVEFKNDTKNNQLEKAGYKLLSTYSGPYVMQSFNPLSVYWFKKHAKEVVRGQLSSRHENIPFIYRLIMRNVMTNILTKPDFVIYDIKGLDSWIIKALKKRSKPIFGYTAKSLLDFKNAQSYDVRAVFENFDPKDL